jgi:chaperone modulatory protein CbpM
MELENLIALDQFCQHHKIKNEFFISLSEHEIFEITLIDGNYYLHLDSVGKAEKIIRLHVDLSINAEGIGVILQLLEKLESVESELATAKKQLSILGF